MQPSELAFFAAKTKCETFCRRGMIRWNPLSRVMCSHISLLETTMYIGLLELIQI